MTQLFIDTYYRVSLEPIWTFGGNVSHAHLLRRPDVQRHLQMCRDELSFRYVRCHDFFGDRMEVMRADGSFDFDRIDSAIDTILQCGLTPFIGLSGMPAALAQDPDAVGPTGIRNGPPNDWNKWYEMVYSLLSHLDERYGCDVREWYFEVAPGPEKPQWSGTREEYFRMYDRTARAVKAMNCERKIGMNLADRPDMLDGFLAHLATPSPDFDMDVPRCEFITMDGFIDASTPENAGDGQSSGAAPQPSEPVVPRADGLRERFDAARKKITDALGANVPLYCSAWNSSRGAPALGHDNCNNAAFVARTMTDLLDSVQGALVWNLTDIDETSAVPIEPFHGGHGLITVNDIRKSAFNAFRLLRDSAGYHSERVGVRWTDPVPGLNALAIREEYTLRLMIWNYRQPGALAATPSLTRFTIDGLPDSVTNAHIEVIRPGAGSPYEAWLELGRPQHVNREILEILEASARPASAEVDFREYPPRLEQGMVMQLSIQLPFGEDEGNAEVRMQNAE